MEEKGDEKGKGRRREKGRRRRRTTARYIEHLYRRRIARSFKKFEAFYGVRMFITLVQEPTRAREMHILQTVHLT